MKRMALLSAFLIINIIPTAPTQSTVHITQADSLDKARKHLAFGGRNLKAKQYADAKNQLEKSWAYFPASEKTKRAQCARLLGRLYDKTEKYDDAIFWYQKAVTTTPKSKYNKQAYRALANIYTHQQRSKEAIKIYESLLAYPADNKTKIGYLYNITILYIEQENYDHALQSAKKWSALAPEDPRVHELLSKLHMKTGGQDEAITQMEHLLQMNPNDIKTLGQLAEIYDQRNNAVKAFIAYEQLYLKDKENYHYLKQMLTLGEQLQKPTSDKISILKKMHKLHPHDVWVIESVADLTEDIVWIKKGLKLDPKNGRLLYLMGEHHYNKWRQSNTSADSLEALGWYKKTLANIQWKDQAQQMLDIINPPMTKQDSILQIFWHGSKTNKDTAQVKGKK